MGQSFESGAKRKIDGRLRHGKHEKLEGIGEKHLIEINMSDLAEKALGC